MPLARTASAVAFLLVLGTAVSYGQRVYNIPPEQTPYSWQLDPGDVINLGAGGVLSAGDYYDSGGLLLPSGVYLNATGGVITPDLTLAPGARADLSGGVVGDRFTAMFGSQASLHGADFKIDGVPVSGLTAVGDETTLNLPIGVLLTGRFADGTPFAFSALDWGYAPSAYNYSYEPDPVQKTGDSFAYNALKLVQEDVAPPTADAFVAVADDPLTFIDGPQTLTIGEGANVGSNFMAGVGGSVVIDGDTCDYYDCSPSIGDNFEAIGATVTMTDGSIGSNADLFLGSVMTVAGGEVGSGLQVHRDSQLSIQGGVVGAGLEVLPGGTVTLSGGEVQAIGAYYAPPYEGYVSVHGEGLFRVAGGELKSNVELLPGGQLVQTAGAIRGDSHLTSEARLEVSGGYLGRVEATSSSTLLLKGANFAIDGVAVDSLGHMIGDQAQVNLPAGGLLTGTLADGRPVALSYQEDLLADGTLTLERAAEPATGPAMIVAPTDSAPDFIRDGQTVRVEPGGQLPNYFAAGVGSRVELAGGAAGSYSEFSGADVVITDGSSLGSDGKAYDATVLLEEGRVGSNFTTYRDAAIEVRGGQLLSRFRAKSGSAATISGGFIGSDFKAESGSTAKLVGYGFAINGTPIADLVSTGDQKAIDLGGNQLLTGSFADGSPFAFLGDDGDSFAAGTLTLELAESSAAPPEMVTLPGDEAPAFVRDGQQLHLNAGGVLPNYFIAGPGSHVLVNGGRLGSYSEAIHSTVVINAGDLGYNFKAFGADVTMNGGEASGTTELFRGTTFAMQGGILDGSLYVYRNATAVIDGGVLDSWVQAKEGSTLTIRAATVNDDVTAYANASVLLGDKGRFEGVNAYQGSQVTLAGGSYEDDLSISSNATVVIQGAQFQLNGLPIDDLTSHGGQLSEYDILTGVFADGTPFAFSERNYGDSLHGLIKLEFSPYTPGPETVSAASQPLGVHQGQTVTVGTGESLQANFNAGHGSVVRIEGGEIGENFEATGAVVVIHSGAIHDDADFYSNSHVTLHDGTIGDDLFVGPSALVEIHGGAIEYSPDVYGRLQLTSGSIGRYLYARPGGAIEIHGGEVDNYWRVESGARLTISGGELGDYGDIYGDAQISGGNVGRGLEVQKGGVLTVSGGDFESDFDVYGDAHVTISGGQFADGIEARDNASINFVGGEFLLNGQPISGFTYPGESMELTARNGEQLTVLFADGEQEQFVLNPTNSSADYFDPDAILTLVWEPDFTPLPGDFNGDGLVDAADYTVWRDNLGAESEDVIWRNGDGLAGVDDGDYEVWRANYGSVAEAIAASDSAIPEPTALWLGLLAAAAPARRPRVARLSES